MSCFTPLSRLARNEDGGAIIISSLLIMFVLLGMFALSIDHNRNFMYQSDMQGKVRGYSFHLAQEYRNFKIRETMEKLAQTTGDPQLKVSIEPGMQILPEIPDVGGNGGTLTDAVARDRIAKEALRLMRLDGHLTDTSTVIVEQTCGPMGTNGRPMLLAFHAIKPQSDVFAKTKVANMTCTKKNDPGCVTVSQFVDLGISCDASNEPDVPVGSTIPPGPGKCGPDNSGPGEFSRDDGELDYTSSTTINPPAGSIASPYNRPAITADNVDFTAFTDVAFSLDIKSKKTGADNVTKFADTLKMLNKALNADNNNLWGGLTLGNVPTYGAGITTAAKNSDNMGSGGLYSTSRSVSGEGAANNRKEDNTRKWQMEGVMWAQDIRRCDKDPVWTYKSVGTGKYCWYGVMSDAPQQIGGKNLPNNCAATFGPAYLGVLRGVTDSMSNGCVSLDRDTDGDTIMDDCTAGNSFTQWSCVVKESHEAQKGQWFAACPKDARGPGQVYQSPEKFLESALYYSRTLRKDNSGNGVDVSTYKLGPVGATITAKDLDVAGGSDKVNDNIDELAELAKKNTDRAWPWACRSPVVDPGPGRANGQGSYGLPFGEIGGNPLVDPVSQADIGAAINNNGDSLCQLPTPLPKSAKQLTIEYNFDSGCDKNTNEQQGCDLPEGFYRAELSTKGLKPKRGPKDPREPDGSINTKWMPEGGEWVIKGKSSVGAGGVDPDPYAIECPYTAPGVVSGTPAMGTAGQVYATTRVRYGDAAVQGKYAAEWVEDGNEEEIVMPEIPAEQLNIAAVNMERRRTDGQPFTCTFESGEGDFRGSQKETYVQNVNNTSKTADQICDPGKYPWFCNKTWPMVQRETNFWYLSGKAGGGAAGILSFNGDMGDVTIPLGVEQAAAIRYGAYKVMALNNGSSDAGTTPSRATNIWTQGKGYNIGTRQLLQVQNLDLVRMKDSDFPPPNLPVVPKGLLNAIAVVQAGYKPYDIQDGQGLNQCALLNASFAKLNQRSGGGSPPSLIKSTPKTVIWLGACPEAGDKIYQGKTAYWSAHGNGIGELGSAPNVLGPGKNSKYQLKKIQEPTSVDFGQSMADCFTNTAINYGASDDAIVFALDPTSNMNTCKTSLDKVVKGTVAGCTGITDPDANAACASSYTAASKIISTHLYAWGCPTPYCEMGDPSMTLGMCVSRLMMCIMRPTRQG